MVRACPSSALFRLALVPALLALVAAASGPPPRRLQKMGRILELEDRRSVGGAELDRYLRDPDRSVRRRAALAAGRIGDASLVPTLADLMNDQEREVRQVSAFALGLIGDSTAVDRLIAALGDSEPIVRGRAAEALGRLGEARAAAYVARQVLAALPKSEGIVAVRGDDAASPTDPWLELRLGLLALARLKDARAAETALLGEGRPRFDWWAATYAAMRVGSPSLKPVLVASSSASDPLCRALAARGLGALKDPGAIETLNRLARDRDESVVVSALGALGALGDARGMPAVAAALASSSPAIAYEALRAVVALPPDRALRGKVVALVGHKEPWVRAAALPALAHTDRDEFALVLSGLDPDPVWFVRAGLAAALAEAGGEVSVELLFGMLKDEDPRVLPSVLQALVKARGRDAIDTLRRHLEHPDLAGRAAAAEGLAALRAAGQSAVLSAAYQCSLGDIDVEARLAEVAALAVQNDPEARATLLEAARRDPARVVRARAAAALRALGEAAPDPGPEGVVRPALDYRLAMAPYDPIPGVPLYTPRAFLHTRRGTIEVHLDIVEAPLSALSFVDLARRGFYDGLAFDRLEPTSMVEGGDPRGDGYGGPGYTLRSEVGERPYGRGTVGLARSGADRGGSRFFITLSPRPELDGTETVLGRVASGMEIVDALRPGDVIESVEVWTGP